MFIYPENLKAKPMLWLWQLRDVAIICLAALVSAFALAQGAGSTPLIVTAVYAFLSIRKEEKSVLDFLRHAAAFLFFQPQYYEWRQFR